MTASCYLIIQPDPNKTVSDSYVIKFGDGPRAASYRTTNPDHFYVQNDLAPSAQLTVVVYPEIKREKKQPGKWLEWVHIKITGGQKDYGRTEWHRLVVKDPNNSVLLRDNLCRMLDIFPYWNRWDEIDSSNQNQQTKEFEQLVDDTWSYDNPEAIAYFTTMNDLPDNVYQSNSRFS